MKGKIISLLMVITMSIYGGAAYGVEKIDPLINDFNILELYIPNSVNIYCDEAVYVAEASSGTNYNLMNQNNLVVGNDEFAYQFYTLMKFSAITESQGGVLPDEAEVTKATLYLYMNESKVNDMDLKECSTSFNESTVTWNTKPGAGTTFATTDFSGVTGWTSVELPASLINGWIDSPSTNRGFYLQPSDASYGTYNFRSDDYTGYQPKLVLQYTGADAVEQEDYEVPDDETPCELTYTVYPETPSPGELMTITVTATDDTALEHVMIVRGSDVLAIEEATDTSTTTLSVSYTEVAELPSMAYGLVADDIGTAQSIWENVIIPVRGTDTAPTVTMDVTHHDVVEAVPVEYTFVEEDGQRVTIRVTATDPEGIEDLSILVNGRYHDYHYTDGRTSATETVFFQNTTGTESLGYAYANGDSYFSYAAYARDAESQLTTLDSTSYTISPITALRLPYAYTPPFVNTGVSNLSWTRMTQVFGNSECWVSKDVNWKRIKALIYYEAAFKDVADGGRCFGFSTMVAEMYNGRLTASDIQNFAAPYQLDESINNTVPYTEARQAAQLGSSMIIEKISQWFDADDSDAHTNVLADVRHDLLADRLGVLCIREGDSGHALVPWMIREMSDGTTRIYVYDPNRTTACRNPAADIDAYSHFPYLTLEGSSWSYIIDLHNSGAEDDEIWNDKIFYYTYSHTIGGTSDTNNISTSGKVTTVTDHDIPTLLDALIGLISGDATMYMEDEAGRITGVKDGVYYEEIPGSMAISDDMGSSRNPNMFVIPSGVEVTAYVSGDDGSAAGQVNDGKYYLGFIQGESVFSMENKALSKGGLDRIGITHPTVAAQSKYTLMTDSMNSDCRIGLYEEIPGKVEANGDDAIGREFFLKNMTFSAGSSLSMYVTEEAEALVLDQETGTVKADLVMRSTEVLDLMAPEDSVIPESLLEDINLTDEGAVEFEPRSWLTTMESGEIIATEPFEVDYSTASSWAVEELQEAVAYGLTTPTVLSKFREDITREEFCEIVVKLYEQLSGSDAPVIGVSPFTDTDNQMILQANKLGIVNGVGNNLFAPDNSITRQEMSVMIYRTLNVALPETDFSTGGELDFDDAGQVASWATDSVLFMNQNGIMKGVGDNQINPLGTTPCEQAIVLLKRTFEAFR